MLGEGMKIDTEILTTALMYTLILLFALPAAILLGYVVYQKPLESIALVVGTLIVVSLIYVFLDKTGRG